MDFGKTAWGMHEKQNIKGKTKEVINTLKRSGAIQPLEAMIHAFVEAGLWPKLVHTLGTVSLQRTFVY
jgi:hypothetical protein